MRDPFTVLGVRDDAGDAQIRQRYLALVRAFPPDRAPERFEELRAAYEALSDERKRLETKLLHINSAGLARLSMQALRSGVGNAQPLRAKYETVAAVLMDGIKLALQDQSAVPSDDGR